jgi:hypothetical protein
MTELAEATREVQILDEHGQPLRADDHARRFFEGPWLHKYQGRYYLSYSTGNTHLLCYAVGDSPYGPFTYGGVILTPSWAGPRTTPSASSKGSGTCSITMHCCRRRHPPALGQVHAAAHGAGRQHPHDRSLWCVSACRRWTMRSPRCHR